MRTTKKWIGILLIAVLCLSMVTGLAEGKTTGSIRNDVSGGFSTIYSEARGDAATEMTIPAGTSLGEVEVSGDWVKVNYLGLTNYVHKDDVVLTTTEPEPQNKEEEVKTKESSDTVTPWTEYVSLASGQKAKLFASIGGAVLGEYPNGTVVTVSEKQAEGYATVNIGGTAGFMY